MPYPEAFWQALLRAELSWEKAGAALEAIEGEPDPVEALFALPFLTERERGRGREAFRAGYQKPEGSQVLSPEAFPATLTTLGTPPPALWVWGEAEALSAPTVAIVGTRNASTYGRACARKFAEGLARAGATVVSGGALGIDAAAHEGALSAEGRTVAALATGVEGTYPAVHAGLFARIRERGALLSQFGVGSQAEGSKFLMRNALIAALARAVVVIEAPYKSGAMRTAHDAAELGREVFAVPATIDNANYFGSFSLLKEGATLATRPEDVIETLGLSPAPAQGRLLPATSLGERVLQTLTLEPMPVDKLGAALAVEPGALLAELTVLELDGKVVRDGVGYARVP